MTTKIKPRCPVCGGRGVPHAGGNFKCKSCRGIFSDRNEGIFASHNDPVRSAMQAERKPDTLRSS